MVGDGDRYLVIGDAMDKDFYCIIGDKDEIDGRALGAGTGGNTVEGVDAGGGADGCDVGAVGQDLLHILNRIAFRVGIEVTGDENGEIGSVLFSELILLFKHLTNVIDAPHLTLDSIGCIKVVCFQNQRAVRIDQRQLFAVSLVGEDCPSH